MSQPGRGLKIMTRSVLFLLLLVATGCTSTLGPGPKPTAVPTRTCNCTRHP